MRIHNTLLMRFSVIGLLITLAVAAVLGFLMQRELTGDALSEAGDLASAHVTAGLSSHLTRADLSTPMTAKRIAELDTLVNRDLMKYGSVVRVKIWNRDGAVVYSDDKAIIGSRFGVSDDLDRALGGEVAANVSNLSRDENVGERGSHGQLLEAYVPLRLTGSDQVIGAYEVYSTVDELNSRVAQIKRIVAEGVFGGFGLVYFALFGVVYAASRRLSHQSTENARLARDVTLAYDETIEGWSCALELRDKETEGHSERVTAMTVAVAKTMGISASDLCDMRRGALLHDIGKMGISDSILLKPGPLDESEWAIMRQHPVYAKNMLEHVGFLGRALEIPYSHHERWDGTGYPQGLRGEDIPLSARIFAIIDVWDALSSDRPYRPAWSAEGVRQELLAQSGKQFDPAIVPVFLSVLHAATTDGGAQIWRDERRGLRIAPEISRQVARPA